MEVSGPAAADPARAQAPAALWLAARSIVTLNTALLLAGGSIVHCLSCRRHNSL